MTSGTISLKKGQPLDLTKGNPGLALITVGLGWKAAAAPGVEFDLDASAFLLRSDGKVTPDENFVFYGNLTSPCSSVAHKGDNRKGDAEGDDEQIAIDLSKVPAHIEKIAFSVTIHEAQQRNQRFGLVKDAYIRVFDTTTGAELGKADLTEDSSVASAILFGELYRRDGEWRFKVTGDAVYDVSGNPGDLSTLCEQFGLKTS